MEKKIRKTAVLLSVIAILFTVFVSFIDVRPIGPQNSEVGFAALNKAVHEALGVHMVLYSITDWLGLAAIAVCVVFALMGLSQVIRRKSLFKADRDLVVLGCIYVAVIILYVFFEKVVINCRPIIMPGCSAPEASFPSSHTLLTCVVMATAFIEVKRRVQSVCLRKVLCTLCVTISAFTVVGRLVSGVHWLTDIFGGLLYSLALVYWFVAFAFRYED